MTYNPDIDPALATLPTVATHQDELALCRAMQQWAAREVDPRNNQRSICISDWFSEEILIANESLPRTEPPHPPEFKQKGLPNG